MKTVFLVLLSTISFGLNGQTTLDTLIIENLLLNSYPEADTTSADFRIMKTIRSFDSNFFEILGRDSIYVAGKYTILRGEAIQIRRLTNKKEAMAAIINDTTCSVPRLDFKALLDTLNNDTTGFLSKLFVRSQFELYYPNFQLPKKYAQIKPRLIAQKLDLKNIIFYTDNFNQKIDFIVKHMSRSQRNKLWSYLRRKYNDVWPGERLSASPIMITDITFGDDNYIYVGADIYGTHYLLTFDENENYKFETKKRLWVY